MKGRRRNFLPVAAACALAAAFQVVPLTGWGDETREVKLDGLTLRVPQSWKQQPPANNLRLGQFEVPGPSEEQSAAELSVFHFGLSDPDSNIARWQSAFQADGRVVRVLSGEFAEGKYIVADIRGTYNKPAGKPGAGGFALQTKPAPDHRMLAVMLLHKKRGAYFLKLVGPQATVTAAEKSLRASFGGDPAQEQPYQSARE